MPRNEVIFYVLPGEHCTLKHKNTAVGVAKVRDRGASAVEITAVLLYWCCTDAAAVAVRTVAARLPLESQ